MIHFISKLLLHVQPDQGFVKISIYCVLYMNLNCPAAQQPNDLKGLESPPFLVECSFKGDPCGQGSALIQFLPLTQQGETSS